MTGTLAQRREREQRQERGIIISLRRSGEGSSPREERQDERANRRRDARGERSGGRVAWKGGEAREKSRESATRSGQTCETGLTPRESESESASKEGRQACVSSHSEQCALLRARLLPLSPSPSIPLSPLVCRICRASIATVLETLSVYLVRAAVVLERRGDKDSFAREWTPHAVRVIAPAPLFPTRA